MKGHSSKTHENKNLQNAKKNSSLPEGVEPGFQFGDNRPVIIAQRRIQEIAENSPKALQLRSFQRMLINSPSEPVQKQGLEEEELQLKKDPVQKKANKTGLPDNLKSGIENISGYSMDDVKVNYNSDKPAQLNAHAYAQGTDIHLASGQEKHLPHEAWHVVQQKQGRVKPTMQMKGTVKINDDEGLEKEAHIMGAKALMVQRKEKTFARLHDHHLSSGIIQREGGILEAGTSLVNVAVNAVDIGGELESVGDRIGDATEVAGAYLGASDAMEGLEEVGSVSGFAGLVNGALSFIESAPKAATFLMNLTPDIQKQWLSSIGNSASEWTGFISSRASEWVSQIPGAATLASWIPGTKVIASGAKAVAGLAEAWEASGTSTKLKALRDSTTHSKAKLAASLIYDESWFKWAYGYARSGVGVAEIITNIYAPPGGVKVTSAIMTKVYESGVIGWVINKTSGKVGVSPIDEGTEARKNKLIALVGGLISIKSGKGGAHLERELIPLYQAAKEFKLDGFVTAVNARMDLIRSDNPESRYQRFKAAIS
jgi:hypothetical protein